MRTLDAVIERDEIEAKAVEFDIHTSHVQRDYVFGWLIDGLYEASPLGQALVLKGGNALRKGYFPLTRFSDDLDFSTSGPLGADSLIAEFNQICRFAEARSGVRFDLDRNDIFDEHMIDDQRRVYKMRLYFQDFTGNADHITLRVRIDVTEFDRLRLPTQTRRLIHPYSDSADCNADIRVVKLEEALADKLSCLIQRRHSDDLFDLVYCVFVNDEVDVNRGEIVHTFLQKSVFGNSPFSARELLLGAPWDVMSGFWNQIVCPKVTRFSFERAVELVKEGVAALFAPFNYGGQIQSGAFFPPGLRNPILQAATDQTLLRMTYHGRVRLVEPYALAYKIRRSDGVAQEYFYVWDTTGGNTSGPGIKTFIQAGIQSVENTDQKFDPRFVIELAKAPSRDGVGYFGGPFARGLSFAPRRIRITRVTSTRSYRIQCSYCGKMFTRKTPSTRLNEHKDPYGKRCMGRVGIRLA